MSNDEQSQPHQQNEDRVKPARKLGRELPKFLQDGGPVMIFGAKRAPDVPTTDYPNTTSDPGANS